MKHFFKKTQQKNITHYISIGYKFKKDILGTLLVFKKAIYYLCSIESVEFGRYVFQLRLPIYILWQNYILSPHL